MRQETRFNGCPSFNLDDGGKIEFAVRAFVFQIRISIHIYMYACSYAGRETNVGLPVDDKSLSESSVGQRVLIDA